jgi:hypothetical protein
MIKGRFSAVMTCLPVFLSGNEPHVPRIIADAHQMVTTATGTESRSLTPYGARHATNKTLRRRLPPS